MQCSLWDKLHFLPDFLAQRTQSLFVQMVQWRTGFHVQNASPREWAKGITLPVLVVHGDQDRVIQQSRGRTLFHAYGSQDRTWISLSGDNHHNVLVTPVPLYATMGTWLLQHVSD